MTAPHRDPHLSETRPHWSIEEVLTRIDLADLLDQLAQPGGQTVRGRRWHCPIQGHDDQHASVTMHIDHRGHERWRCWSGDNTHRGDAIDLVMATQHTGRIEAVDWLATRAGMTPDRPLPPITRKPPTPTRAVALDPVVEQYAGACEKILWTRAGLPVREWLAQRGLGEVVLRANHVGADPGRRLPRARGLPYGASIAAVFPALDPTGHLRYLQTRYLHPGDGPKYDNPAAVLGFNPRLAWAAAVSRPAPGVLVVCEGIPDALIAAQAGLHAVAILGAQAPDHTVAGRLATHAERHGVALLAVPDNDSAGHGWASLLGEHLVELGHTLSVIAPPEEGLDLNDWALKDPGWAEQLRSPTRDLQPSPAQTIEPPGTSVA
ncbi:MAG: toprim domain-containing protein [Actinomycetota bacterium]|nr:toprim domain-containing protein [Actinomycetota bacterium]